MHLLPYRGKLLADSVSFVLIASSTVRPTCQQDLACAGLDSNVKIVSSFSICAAMSHEQIRTIPQEMCINSKMYGTLEDWKP